MSEQETINELKDLIVNLKNENKELEKKISSRRYRIADKLVDTSYSLLHFKNFKKSKKTGEIKSEKNHQRTIDKGRVDIINVNFYDWDGKTVFRGGAERYVFDLACLLKKMGYRPRLLQGANHDFEKEFHNIPVVGIKMKNQNMRMMSSVYNNVCKDAEFIIASPLELASELTCNVPVISINHGINFDHISNRYQAINNYNYADYIDGLIFSDYCVCVDTNFINWVRTRDYKLSLKMEYIPNYYDEKTFKNIKRKKNKRLTFVYPRRIYSARGHDITLQAFRKIIKKYPNSVELHMIGQIDNKSAKKDVDEMLAEFPNNFFQTSYPMKDMYKAYEKADVVIIPTRYSEGTSLSCIEGMASGAAVIATNVGGLPNLIIDEFNGLLISPTANALKEAAEKLIENPTLRKSIAKNGETVAKAAFQKDNWDTCWEKIISLIK